jgi:CBS domain-containing protein
VPDQVAIPIATVPVARTDDPADLVVERMFSHQGRPALVLDDAGNLAGVVSLADLERATSWTPRARR